jgi:hypothetical protein
MAKTLFLLPVLLLVFGMGYAYAQPFEDTSITVLDYNGVSATVKIEWNPDEAVRKYEIGCVSCMPNISETIFENNITLDDVAPFTNTKNAMLYIISYDSNDEIIDAKQILVNME